MVVDLCPLRFRVPTARFLPFAFAFRRADFVLLINPGCRLAMASWPWLDCLLTLLARARSMQEVFSNRSSNHVFFSRSSVSSASNASWRTFGSNFFSSCISCSSRRLSVWVLPSWTAGRLFFSTFSCSSWIVRCISETWTFVASLSCRRVFNSFFSISFAFVEARCCFRKTSASLWAFTSEVAWVARSER